MEAIRTFKGFRKEDRIAEILEKRGTHPGLVHVFSAMENCNCFKPWHDRATGHTYLKAAGGRCAHLYFYFYFIDELLGLCYLRVPTWAPFRLQFYCNGHNWLAAPRKNRLHPAGQRHRCRGGLCPRPGTGRRS